MKYFTIILLITMTCLLTGCDKTLSDSEAISYIVSFHGYLKNHITQIPGKRTMYLCYKDDELKILDVCSRNNRPILRQSQKCLNFNVPFIETPSKLSDYQRGINTLIKSQNAIDIYRNIIIDNEHNVWYIYYNGILKEVELLFEGATLFNTEVPIVNEAPRLAPVKQKSAPEPIIPAVLYTEKAVNDVIYERDDTHKYFLEFDHFFIQTMTTD